MARVVLHPDAAPISLLDHALTFLTRAGAAIGGGIAEGRRRSRGVREWSSALGAYGLGAWSGWTDNRHEQIRHYRGWVYIAISAVARKLADRPPQCGLLRASGEGDVQRYLRRGLRTKALNRAVAEGNDEIEIFPDSHPLNRLFNDPNEPDVGYHLWFQTYLWYALTGNSYWWTPRQSAASKLGGLPDEIWVPPAEWVTPVYYGTGKWVDGYEIRTYRSGKTISVDPSEMIHFRDPHPYDLRDGYSPLTAGSHWIDIENSLSRSRLASFKNGHRPSIGIQLDAATKDPLDSTLERIYARWDARMAGEANHGRPFVGTPGATLVNLAGFSPAEMAFLESDNQVRDTVLGLFGVPYPITGFVGGATYENADAAIRNFYQQRFNPLRRFFGQVITEKVGRVYDENCVVFWPDDTPIDPEQERKDDESLFDRGGMTPNERRIRRGMEPAGDPNADKLYILSGYTPLEDAGLPEPTAADGASDFGGDSSGGDKPDKPEKAFAFPRNGHASVNGH